MKTLNYSVTVQVPEPKELLKKYPRFSSLVLGDGKFLFDLVMQPEVFLRAKTVADLGYPSVLAVAEQCTEAVAQQSSISWDGFTKQFVGAAICTLMEANGYEKTGIKKRVPHHSFSVGEVYTAST